jgi:hypothetical protein
LLLGSNGELLQFDLQHRQVVARLQLTGDPLESVYDIKLLPAQFSLPPADFQKNN